MKNPLTGKKMSREAAAYVEQLRTVRRNAKKAARSGNPAKRYPAVTVLAQIPHLLAATYRQDALRQKNGVSA